MTVERTPDGLAMRLGVAGIGRLIGAAFLGVWLTGWAAGEGFALWILGRGAWSFITGRPPGVGHEPVGAIAALGAGLFLLAWLTLWTFGGIAAGREFLRMLFGRDVLLVRPDGLEIRHPYGLFRSVRHVARTEIHRFYQTSPGAPVSVQTAQGTKVLARLGTPAERAELTEKLSAEFNVEASSATVGAIPKGWCETMSLEHERILITDPAARRKQATLVWIICAVLSLIPLYLVAVERQRPDLLVAVLFFVALAGLAGWGATWLSFGRSEWKLERGRLVLQRRFGQNVTPRFEAASLELAESNSSDHGPYYVLSAMAAGAPAQASSGLGRQHRRTIDRQSDDPTALRNFGAWLNQQCGIPFADLTTTKAKAMDLEVLKQQLAGSGRLGRVILGIVERLAPSPPAQKE